MNKFILATAAVALSASTAMAGMYGDTAETETDPYVPVEVAASSSSAAGGVGTALAVIGGLVVVGALAAANDGDSSSSTGTP
ncbi:hypothetical protein [Tropicibacter oceani]|uniref:Ferrochelatase n=1 Tax=Tropicibacter oceani TaxID=3058420 RepID=A0ABY8QIA2_9RHOB|nr:hypothetical protein [Tropicibacter oceani]WGW04255.1 hypothetical protein QF118_01580 [Tropicibacter oceani]